MKKLVALVLISILLACSSSNKEVYSKYKDLSEGGKWVSTDEVFFKVNIDDVSSPYEMKFFFRCLDGFQFKNLNIKVTQISPSKVEEIAEYSLKVIDENGEFVGEELASIYDSENVVEANKRFKEKGKYIFKVEPNMSVPEVNNAVELGLALSKKNNND